MSRPALTEPSTVCRAVARIALRAALLAPLALAVPAAPAAGLALRAAPAAGPAVPLAASAAAVPAPSDTSALEAAPDTGWVEIGSSPFGKDDPFADLPGEEESPEAAPPPHAHLRPYLDFNRVDQFTLGLDHAFTPKTGLLPGFAVRVARSLRRESSEGDGRWLWRLALEQPIDAHRSAVLGVSQYRFTAHDDSETLPDAENLLAAYFFHWDYRDYYDLVGTQVSARWTWNNAWTLSALHNDDHYGSIPLLASGTKSLFRRSQPWRANPPVEDGQIKSVTFGLEYDTRAPRGLPKKGMWNRFAVETAGGSQGGDFGYVRWSGDVRAYISPAPGQTLRTRVEAGTTGGGPLPFQRTFAVGGIGTLRAHNYDTFRGRNLFLANGEWAYVVLKRSSRNVAIKTGVQVVAFSDFGLAWDAPVYDLARRQPAWDGGLGLGTTDENLRVYFARDLRAQRAPVHVTLRLSRSF